MAGKWTLAGSEIALQNVSGPNDCSGAGRYTVSRDDPQFAAELLLGMLAGHDRVKRLFGVERANGADEARSRQIVDCFLRAYQP